MKKNTQIENEIEKTLNVLKNSAVPEPNPFLFTRIINEIENRESGASNRKFSISPAYNLIMACLIALNIFSVIYYIETDTTTADYRKEYISELADEYSINYKSEF